MEFAADVEGAKLAKKAGYDLSKARETISFLNTLAYADELNSSHPSNEKRLKNFARSTPPTVSNTNATRPRSMIISIFFIGIVFTNLQIYKIILTLTM